MPWTQGTTEVGLLSVIFGVIIGVPLLLYYPNVLNSPSVVFYLFLFIIGTFGHIDDVKAENLKRLDGPSVWKQIAGGLAVFVVLELMFTINLAYLETSPKGSSMTPLQILAFNAAFVIPGEELVFRDTLPYYLTFLFNIKLKDEFSSTALAFIISSVLFGLFHTLAYNFDYIAVLKAIFAGILLGAVRMFLGLLASYIAHFVFNSVNILGILALAPQTSSISLSFIPFLAIIPLLSFGLLFSIQNWRKRYV